MPTRSTSTGDESYRLRVRDIGTGRDLPVDIPDVSTFTWAPTARRCSTSGSTPSIAARFVYRHRLGTDPANDPLVYEEKDLGFEVSVGLTRTKRFILISTGGPGHVRNLADRRRAARKRPVLVAARERSICNTT